MSHHPASPNFNKTWFSSARHGPLVSSPKAPVVPEPTPIPDVEDAQVAKARRKVQTAAQSRTGRQSTILTDYGVAKSEKLGG